MAEIKEGQELKLCNVLTLRKKMGQAEIQQETMNIGEFIQKNMLKKSGPVVTATHTVEQVGSTQVMDIEIMVPLDKKIPEPEPYKQKAEFILKDALYARHEGNPQLLQNTLNEMVEYMRDNKLQQTTSIYNAAVSEPKPGEGLDKVIMDCYIGVRRSDL